MTTVVQLKRMGSKDQGSSPVFHLKKKLLNYNYCSVLWE